VLNFGVYPHVGGATSAVNSIVKFADAYSAAQNSIETLQVRSSNEQAIKHMQDFKTGLSGALKTSLETSSSPTGELFV